MTIKKMWIVEEKWRDKKSGKDGRGGKSGTSEVKIREENEGGREIQEEETEEEEKVIGI